MNDGRSFLLDTNVVSETRRLRMHGGVRQFFDGTDPARLFISVLTLGELRRGIAMKARSDASAAQSLAGWVDGIEHGFTESILPICKDVAGLWGKLSADRPRPVIDTLIAATALTHGMVLVTRNAKDVEGLGLTVLNPWQTSTHHETTP